MTLDYSWRNDSHADEVDRDTDSQSALGGAADALHREAYSEACAAHDGPLIGGQSNSVTSSNRATIRHMIALLPENFQPGAEPTGALRGFAHQLCRIIQGIRVVEGKGDNQQLVRQADTREQAMMRHLNAELAARGLWVTVVRTGSGDDVRYDVQISTRNDSGTGPGRGDSTSVPFSARDYSGFAGMQVRGDRAADEIHRLCPGDRTDLPGVTTFLGRHLADIREGSVARQLVVHYMNMRAREQGHNLSFVLSSGDKGQQLTIYRVGDRRTRIGTVNLP